MDAAGDFPEFFLHHHATPVDIGLYMAIALVYAYLRWSALPRAAAIGPLALVPLFAGVKTGRTD